MRVLVAFGTRPEIIKLAPVYRALRRRMGIHTDTVWTGQQVELAAGLLERERGAFGCETLRVTDAGIAAISLAVAGILVMNVMLVSVAQRTAEIGLLKALGATGGTIRTAFLTEAAMLSLAGAVLGFLFGHAGAALIRLLYPVYPAYPPDWAVIAGLSTALATGLLFGVMPARRAASLDPIVALRFE